MVIFRSCVAFVAGLLLSMYCLAANDKGEWSSDADLGKVYDVAYEAYLYAYPMVIMDITMQQATNVKDGNSVPMRSPVNQFSHFREYPGADVRDVVRFNFDTLYSFSWLDVSDEPVVLSLPDMGDRYYLMPMLDMWTDVFAVPGTRTTGNEAGEYAIVGPEWVGEVDEDLKVIRAPTPVVWVMGRTQTNGVKDFDNVHKIQDQYTLTPLGRWLKGERGPDKKVHDVDPDMDDKTSPLEIINSMTGVELLERFSELALDHAPHYADYPILHRMEIIGLKPGQSWEAGRLDKGVIAKVNQAAVDALKDIKEMVSKGAIGVTENGWNYATNLGSYGTDYQLRAMVALAGLGANLGKDAIYPNGLMDAEGNPTTGAHRYTLDFPKGELPPAQAFWSLTMYDHEGFQVANELNRFAIGDRDDLSFNDDGSLTIYIQHENPGPEKVSNWLPAPEGPFQVLLRIYSPASEAFREGLNLPPIKKLP